MIEITRIFLGVAGSVRFALALVLLMVLVLVSAPLLASALVNFTTESVELTLLALVVAFPTWFAFVHHVLRGRTH